MRSIVRVPRTEVACMYWARVQHNDAQSDEDRYEPPVAFVINSKGCADMKRAVNPQRATWAGRERHCALEQGSSSPAITRFTEGVSGSSDQARRLHHAGGAGQVRCELGPQLSEHVVGLGSAVVALDAVVHLDQVDPAHQGPGVKQILDPSVGRFVAVESGEDRPGVETDAHRGSAARSSRSRSVMPLRRKRPPSDRERRRATMTISSSRSSTSTSSPGCREAPSRTCFGMTTCPSGPTRTVIRAE